MINMILPTIIAQFKPKLEELLKEKGYYDINSELIEKFNEQLKEFGLKEYKVTIMTDIKYSEEDLKNNTFIVEPKSFLRISKI